MYRFPRVAEKQWSIAWHKTGPKQEADSGVIEVVGGPGLPLPYGRGSDLGNTHSLDMGNAHSLDMGNACASDLRSAFGLGGGVGPMEARFEGWYALT